MDHIPYEFGSCTVKCAHFIAEVTALKHSSELSQLTRWQNLYFSVNDVQSLNVCITSIGQFGLIDRLVGY